MASSELQGRLISLAARMVRLDGGCESGHKAGRWHMHEEPYHGTGGELATIAHSWQQLTRVGDEERLRAALVRLQRFTATMMSSSGRGEASFNDLRNAEEVLGLAKPGEYGPTDDLWPERTAAALAPQPPSPASQGEER